MSDRPGYLIATIGPTGHLTIFSTHWTEGEARRMLDGLGRLIGHDHTAYLIVVPEGEGVVDEPQIRLEPKSPSPAQAAPAPMSDSAPASAPAQPPAPAEKPAPFRRRSQAEFEAETIAMMNGEIPMDGIRFRDADAPLSEGGAIS
jgi:hypothetical protein